MKPCSDPIVVRLANDPCCAPGTETGEIDALYFAKFPKARKKLAPLLGTGATFKVCLLQNGHQKLVGCDMHNDRI